MTKTILGLPSGIEDSTYQQNREDDIKISQLKEELRQLNLKIEETKQKILDKIGA
jgi:peptidoglycan hydrolase CwlO-like protein